CAGWWRWARAQPPATRAIGPRVSVLSREQAETLHDPRLDRKADVHRPHPVARDRGVQLAEHDHQRPGFPVRAHEVASEEHEREIEVLDEALRRGRDPRRLLRDVPEVEAGPVLEAIGLAQAVLEREAVELGPGIRRVDVEGLRGLWVLADEAVGELEALAQLVGRLGRKAHHEEVERNDRI